MKKLQLRKIIRESIKELMVEQTGYAGWNQVIVPQPTGSNANSCITWQQYQYGALCCDSMYNSGYNGTPVTLGFFTLGQGMMHPTPEQHLLNFLPPGTYPCMNAPGCVPTGGNYGYKVESQALYDYFTTHNPLLILTTPHPLSCNNPTGTCLWSPGTQYNGFWGSDGCNEAFSYTPPVITTITLNPGCTDSTATNYDATAEGCEVNGVVDTNDTSCCMIQPGGSTTPTNVGPPMASNDTKSATPTPNPSDPQMKRMKDLAFRGKRK